MNSFGKVLVCFLGGGGGGVNCFKFFSILKKGFRRSKGEGAHCYT